MNVLLRRYYGIGWIENSTKILNASTISAIVSAFGDKSAKIIEETYNYLRAISKENENMAKLMTDYINDDPMFVCNIGIQGFPSIRCCRIRNKSANDHLYNGIILPISFNQIGKMEMLLYCGRPSTMIFCGANSVTDYAGYYSFDGTNNFSFNISRGGKWGYSKVTNVTLTFSENYYSKPIKIGGWVNNSWNFDIDIARWKIYGTDKTTLLCDIVPYVTKNNEVVFLDLVTNTSYHNVYTDPFIIKYYKSDGVTPL